jgi:adenylylsulfate kinase
MVLWLVGLSGSGKTTLGKAIYASIKKRFPNTVFLDGDEVRQIFGNDLSHTVEDRWVNAQRITHLCGFLDRQGIHVVCAVLSIFHESQRWNREHLQDYFEVYIDAPLDQLRRRDPRGLYQAAMAGDIKDVVGVDIEFHPPSQPNLVIRNDSSLEEFLANTSKICALLPGLSTAS